MFLLLLLLFYSTGDLYAKNLASEGQEAKTVHAEDPDKKRVANELVTGY